MWTGEGQPHSSQGSWGTGVTPVAVKRVPLDRECFAERNALQRVQRGLKRQQGPCHVPCLIEFLVDEKEDGTTDMLFITK